jgi:hypothetical protein
MLFQSHHGRAPAAVPHPPWMTISSMPITATPATAGSQIQITQFGMTSSGHFNNLAVARIGGSGRDRFDGLGVTLGSLAGARLDEALAFG